MEGCLEVFGATLEAGNSEIAVTSCGSSCCARASKGTRRSGADAVPRMSPGSRSRYPVRGIVYLPETTKCFEGS